MFTSLKNHLLRLAALWLGLSLFATVCFTGAPRKSWKIAVFRTVAPYAVEIEVALKSHLTKLDYVAGRNLTYLPTVPPVEPIAYLIELNLGKACELGITFDAKTIGPAAQVIP